MIAVIGRPADRVSEGGPQLTRRVAARPFIVTFPAIAGLMGLEVISPVTGSGARPSTVLSTDTAAAADQACGRQAAG